MWAFRSSMSLSVVAVQRAGRDGGPAWCPDRSRTLMIDLEALPARRGGQPFLVQAGDRGARRPLPHPGLQLLEALKLAGGLDLDAAVAQVPHAAGHAQLAGHAAHEPAEADALDASVQPQAQGHPPTAARPVPETAAAARAGAVPATAVPVTTVPAAGAAAARAAAHLPPSFQPWRPTSGTKPTSSPSRRRSSPRADLR